jgi:hypothetical protein
MSSSATAASNAGNAGAHVGQCPLAQAVALQTPQQRRARSPATAAAAAAVTEAVNSAAVVGAVRVLSCRTAWSPLGQACASAADSSMIADSAASARPVRRTARRAYPPPRTCRVHRSSMDLPVALPAPGVFNDCVLPTRCKNNSHLAPRIDVNQSGATRRRDAVELENVPSRPDRSIWQHLTNENFPSVASVAGT